MKNKKKLKGKNIYIQKMTYHERKGKCRKKQENGLRKTRSIKIGFAKVMVEGKWRKWKEIEVEEIGREEVKRNSRIGKQRDSGYRRIRKEKENGNKKVEHEEVKARKSKEKRMEEKRKIKIGK